jgi:hypothetical protein
MLDRARDQSRRSRSPPRGRRGQRHKRRAMSATAAATARARAMRSETTGVGLAGGGGGPSMTSDGTSLSVQAVSRVLKGWQEEASDAGKDDSTSNEVGGFTIDSFKTHLPPTLFQIEGMREQFLIFIAAYPLNFFAMNTSQASGLAIRLQSTTTPEIEGNWTDVNGANLASLGSGAFNVRTGNYPAGNGIYFRTVASANSNADSISNYVGPFQLTANTLPQVTITVPSGTGAHSSRRW